jgi:integrase
MYLLTHQPKTHTPWNKGKLLGQKAPLKLKDIWMIRIHLQMSKNLRNIALFDLALDSKLRGCDLVKLRISDISPTGEIGNRAKVIQQKTNQPVQFEITQQTRDSLNKWIKTAKLGFHDYIFISGTHPETHIKTRQYARIVKSWINMAGLNPAAYGTHSLRRTKPTLIYRKTKNLRVVQLLLGHTKLESTVRYLGIEVDDALEISEKIEI